MGAALGVISYDIWVRDTEGGPSVGVLLIAIMAAVLVWLLSKFRFSRSQRR